MKGIFVEVFMVHFQYSLPCRIITQMYVQEWHWLNGTKSDDWTNPFSSYTFHVNMHSYSEYSHSKYVYMYVC